MKRIFALLVLLAGVCAAASGQTILTKKQFGEWPLSKRADFETFKPLKDSIRPYNYLQYRLVKLFTYQVTKQNLEKQLPQSFALEDNLHLYIDTRGRVQLAVMNFQSVTFEKGKLVRRDTLLPQTTLNLYAGLVQDMLKAGNLHLPTGRAVVLHTRLLAYPTRDVIKAPANWQAILQTTRPDTVRNLNLGSLKLQGIPKEVYRFKNLETLSLENNLLRKVPRRLTRLKKLNYINFSRNFLEDNSLKLKRNNTLQDVNLQYNLFTALPAHLARSNRLSTLFMGNNELIKMSTRPVPRLHSLQILNLYNAGIWQLPERFFGNFSKLTELDLYHNYLSKLPDDLTSLKNLKTLAVSHNRLTKLPDSLHTLACLTKLYAHHNRLTSLPALPPPLVYAGLNDNPFWQFPESLLTLSSLEELDISRAKLEKLPNGLLNLPSVKKIFIKNQNFVSKDPDTLLLLNQLEANGIDVR